MRVVLIDGQGGRLGQLLAEAITEAKLDCELIAVGTNSIAAKAMIKGGAVQGAAGENPVIVACRDADVIIGPIGIVAADSMLGEITPQMAVSIGQSRALKLLLPVSHCNNQVVGVKKMTMSEMVGETVARLRSYIEGAGSNENM